MEKTEQIIKLNTKLEELVAKLKREPGKTINKESDAQTYEEIISTVNSLKALGVGGRRRRRKTLRRK